MRKELFFNNGYNNYSIDKYYFQKNKKKPININVVDTGKIVLFNKTPYGEKGADKNYIAYVGCTGFRPLHIIVKYIKLYTNHMNVLANDNELLKYIKIWNKTETLLNKKRFHNVPVYNEYIKTKISSYNENFHDNKRLTKDEYYGHSILLLEVKHKYYPQTFLNKFFECNSIETRNSTNKNSFFKELVQIADWSDDEYNN